MNIGRLCYGGKEGSVMLPTDLLAASFLEADYPILESANVSSLS